MKRLVIVASLMAVTALARNAGATNGMRMIGFGPTQDAMGGLGVGTTLDAACMVTNPAGLATLDRRIDVGLGWFKAGVSYSATGAQPGMIVRNDGSTLDSSRGGSPIPALGAVIPVSDSFTAGIGLFAVAGMGVDYAANLYQGETHTSYLNARLTPSLAYKLNDMLQIGVTVNAMLAQMSYDVASGFGQAKHDTATSLGIGGVVGLKFTPIPMLSFGAAYETKSYFQNFSFDVAEHTMMTPGGPMTFQAGKDELAFDQPQMVSFGASVKPLGDLLVVGADVEWINWSQTNGQNLPKYTSDTNATGAMPFDLNWSDQWVFKVGAQVSPWKSLAIRAGYDYGKSPLDARRAFENVAFPAVAEHHFTLGAFYGLTDALSVALSGMYAPSVKVTGQNMDQFLTAYETSMSQYQIDLGVSYKL